MNLLIVTQKVDYTDPVLGFFHRWIVSFSEQYSSVQVICLFEGAHSLPKNVQVFSLGKDQGESEITYLYRFYSCILRERKKYDAVFVHMNPIYIVLGGLPWRLLGKKIALWYTHKHVDCKLRIASYLSHVILTAAPESFQLPSKKVHVVGHGINTTLFTPQEGRTRSAFLLLTVGRISRVKGYEILISAMEAVARNDKAVQLSIIGDTSTEDEERYLIELKKQVADRGLQDVVLFLGSMPQEKVATILGQYDAFISASSTGGLDKAVLEAMSSGVPVLTSNKGAYTLLDTYTDTLLFTEGNAKDLSEKIIQLQRLSPQERTTLGAQLRDIVIVGHSLPTLISKIKSIL